MQSLGRRRRRSGAIAPDLPVSTLTIMKSPKILFTLILAVTLSICLSAASFASKADELISKADSAVAKAHRADTGADRDDNYKSAIDDYQRVVKDYPNSVQAVEAKYAIARVYETAKGKYANLHTAYSTYNDIVSRYDRSESELSSDYEKGEIAKIREIVKDAKAEKSKVADEIDKQNSQNVLYKAMDAFVRLTGSRRGFSYWFAIILITAVVKVLITPLTKAQFKAMKEMQKIAPLVKEIQDKYKGDQKAIGEKTMDLYKEHNINPFASCLPILIQMPILWLLYYMIRLYEFQFAKGTFFWIGSGLSHLYNLTVPFGSGGTVWFTARNLSEPDILLVLLYVVSMYISTRLSAVDPTQAEQQKMMAVVMPVMFAFIFAGFPSAFLLYWLVFNIFQTAQQYLIIRGGREEAEAAGPGAPDQPAKPTDEQTRRQRRRRR